MITVIGLGFVGLTAALGFGSKGHKVYGVDIDPQRSGLLNQGRIPFYEPHLEEQLGKTVFFNVPLEQALADSSYVFFCVGTPGQADGRVDLSCLMSAIEDVLGICARREGRKTLVIKSTVPPSTALEKIQPMLEGRNVRLANNPEFLRQGSAWEDFIHPDRIVIGSEEIETARDVAKLYEGFGAPILRVNLNTAEFIKYLSNAFFGFLDQFFQRGFDACRGYRRDRCLGSV